MIKERAAGPDGVQGVVRAAGLDGAQGAVQDGARAGVLVVVPDAERVVAPAGACRMIRAFCPRRASQLMMR